MKSIAKTFVLLALTATGPVLIRAQISNFQHIVIIFQENRTPDNLFQGLCGQNRSQCPTPYDVRNYGFDNKGHKVQLMKVPFGSPYIGSGYTHYGFVTMCDLDKTTNQCKMDGLSSTACGTNPVTCAFLYVNPSDVAPYVTMAKQYGWANFLVVISAYTPKGYVDNLRHDFGSILRFVEHNFGIPEGALNFADQRAATDLTEFFNLSHSPRTFNVIPAPLGEKFFLNDNRPMEPPDTD